MSFNNQLDPKHPTHLRADPVVIQWIENYQQDKWNHHPDCKLCGWPHSSVTMCGMGSTFGRVRLGGEWAYIDTSNVAWMHEFVQSLPKLGFHWQNDIYIRRVGDRVIVSHIEYFNGHPSVHDLKIPVQEFASIVCAASIYGETAEMFKAAMDVLGLAAAALPKEGR